MLSRYSIRSVVHYTLIWKLRLDSASAMNKWSQWRPFWCMWPPQIYCGVADIVEEALIVSGYCWDNINISWMEDYQQCYSGLSSPLNLRFDFQRFWRTLKSHLIINILASKLTDWKQKRALSNPSFQMSETIPSLQYAVSYSMQLVTVCS